MSEKKSKTVVVREHPRRVPISKKNPSGRTIVDRHLRHIEGQYLDLNLLSETFKNYDKKNILQPSKGKLSLPDEDQFDNFIAVWEVYKGILNDNSDRAKKIIANYRKFYELLKSK